MEQFDIKKQSEKLQASTIKAIKGLFPVEGRDKKLVLKDVWADDKLDPYDYQSQFKAKVAERTWGVPIYGSFDLVDKSGKVVKKKEKIRLLTLPKFTPRFSYIVDGSEHQIANQLRLRPAGYTVRSLTGGVKSQINLAKGYSGQIELHANPETGVFRLKVGQANQRLYPILSALGVSDQKLARLWGDEVLESNKRLRPGEYDGAVRSFAKSMTRKTFDNTESAAEELREFVRKTEMDPKINKRTIGASHSAMTGDFLGDMSTHLLKTLRGDVEPHDRNALEFKEYRTINDLIDERLSLTEFRNRITRKIANNINTPGRENIDDLINPTIINPEVKAVFNLPELHQLPKQLNPLDMLNTATTVTVMGPGGITGEHTITDDMRNVHPSHMGYLDPIHTPESSKVGVVYHLPVGVASSDKTLRTRAINVKTGKLERIDPATFSDATVAFPDQYDAKAKKWKNPKGVLVLDKGNKTRTVSSKEVDYILQSPKQAFSFASNLTPFMPTNSGGRALVASKLAEQAVPLVGREKPLVQSSVSPRMTFEELLGSAFSAHAPEAGTVTKVDKNKIVIKGKSGEVHHIPLYDNFPLNYKSFIDSKTKVGKGQVVKEGQVIADTNYTEDGQLALGKNLRTAYIPYKGYNFEDGIVITDEAAKKLTSQHMHVDSAQHSDRHLINRDKFVANYPNAYGKAQVGILDAEGVVKKGTMLQPGDPVIARLRKEEVDPENIVFGKLSRTLMKPWKDDSVKWESDVPGKVVDVLRHGNKIKVLIRTEEQAQIGDKLVNRYGGKGIISKIIPVEQAPHGKDGKPVDLMFNPHGIVTRINVGQVLENAAGKAAKKKGERYVVDNFSGENYTQTVKDYIAKAGVTDIEELIDPETNSSLGKVNVGDQYILKLEKQVRSQFSARGAGPGWKYSQYTQEPVKGGEQGSKAMDLLTFYSMLAHGAKCFLGSTAICTSDGRSLEISDIVRNRRRVLVNSWNSVDRKIEGRPVVAWSCRVADPSELIQLSVSPRSPKGRKHLHKIKVTSGHEFYTPDGKVEAGDLEIGDKLLTPGIRLHAEEGLEETIVLGIEPYYPKQYEDYLVYNIEVEDNHNYFAGNVLVGNSNLREAATYKATRNDDFWQALKLGNILPPPKPTFSYNKFLSYMKGAGIDVKQDGTKLTLAPMTNREIDNLSNGPINEYQFVRAKDLAELKGGLMDRQTTGGLKGTKWSHIDLAEPIVNPVFEQPVKSMLDMDNRTYTGMVEGRVFVDENGEFNEEGRGVTGGNGFRQLLAQVDLKERMETFSEAAKKARNPTALNKANRGARFVEALKKFNLKPEEAYVLDKVPVLPPVFRPVYALPSGDLHTSPVNYLYRDVGLVSDKLKWMNSLEYFPEDGKADLRRDLYQGAAAVAGLGSPIVFYPKNRPVKGLIEEIRGIAGQGSKSGFFQKHVLRREQDLVGRGTIIPEPKLGVDQVGLPEEMAWTIFQPFLMRELTRQGYKPVDADKQIEDRSFIARKALEAVMAERPVLLNRAPSLHKFSVMAFEPKLVDGRAIKIPPLIVKGFNADFDGNCCSGFSSLRLTFTELHGIRELSQLEEALNMKFSGETTIFGSNENGTVVEIEIRDFPRLDTDPLKDKNGALVYQVPKGVKVLSYDHESGEAKYCTVSGLTVEQDCMTDLVTTRGGYEIIASDNDSLCIYDHETGDTRKAPPGSSMRNIVPVINKIPLPKGSYDFDTGWMVGAFVSDGFFMGEREDTIGYSKQSDAHRDRFFETLVRFEGSSLRRKTYGDYHDEGNGITGHSVKDHISRLSKVIGLFKSCYADTPTTGRAALRKKLPTNLTEFSEEALFGIFCGLVDGDGSISWNNSKSKPQLLVNINTSSKHLRDDVARLCKFIGIRCNCSSVPPKEGGIQKSINYVITISTPDMERVSSRLRFMSQAQERFNEFVSIGLAKDDRDIVPVPYQVLEYLVSSNCKISTEDPKLRASLRTIRSSRKHAPYLSRRNSLLLFKYLDDSNDLHLKWKNLVLANQIHWDIISSVEPHKKIEVFDLIVEETKVFAANGGLVIYDTMHVHTPVLPDAVDEARKMLPSQHLYNPGTGNIMLAPSQEAVIGLHTLTTEGKSVPQKFATTEALSKALEDKKVTLSDIVRVAGKKTTAGRAMVDAVLPEKYRGRNQVLTKGAMGSLLTEIAQNDPKEYADAVNKLAELGNKYAYQTGFTVGIDDVQPNIPERDKILAEARVKAKNLPDQDVVKLYGQVDKKLKSAITKNLGAQNNNLYRMVTSGARGNMDQLKQIVSAPLLVEDVTGNTLPIPIEGSFSHGLGIGDYWNSLYGARRGVVDKQLQTSKPGEFNKDLMATVVKNVIAKEDCETDTGLDFSIDDEHAHDRVLARDIKVGSRTVAKRGAMITPNLVGLLRKNRIKKLHARSPLTCKLPQGTCATCYGTTTEGGLPAIGDNIGAIAGQSLTEPLTQMVLRSMHTGGVAGAQQLTGYEKIDKLIRMPKVIVGKATLATKPGKVTTIEDAPAGGKNIFIGEDKHFVSPGNTLKVKKGTVVQRGDPLSDGLIQPRELVQLKGMIHAQQYLTDELTDAYQKTGVPLKKKNVETVVRSLADTTRVLDGGDSSFVFGDVMPYTTAEAFNLSAQGKADLEKALGKPLFKDHGPVKKGTTVNKKVAKILQGLGYNEVSIGPDPIVHEPFLDGVKQLPMLNKDWMAQMGYGHLVRGIKEGAGEAWSSDIHGFSPVPAFAYGAEFGKGKGGKY